jgi:hypothetical protein
MTLYTQNGAYPQSVPFRIRLSSGRTRTDSATFTAQEIADAGYTKVSDMPVPSSVQKVYWDTSTAQWVLKDKTLEELKAAADNLWAQIRAERDKRIGAVTWRYERYARRERFELPQTDKIEDLDVYVQALADIPQNQTDPYNISWPVLVTYTP